MRSIFSGVRSAGDRIAQLELVDPAGALGRGGELAAGQRDARAVVAVEVAGELRLDRDVRAIGLDRCAPHRHREVGDDRLQRHRPLGAELARAGQVHGQHDVEGLRPRPDEPGDRRREIRQRERVGRRDRLVLERGAPLREGDALDGHLAAADGPRPPPGRPLLGAGSTGGAGAGFCSALPCAAPPPAGLAPPPASASRSICPCLLRIIVRSSPSSSTDARLIAPSSGAVSFSLTASRGEPQKISRRVALPDEEIDQPHVAVEHDLRLALGRARGDHAEVDREAPGGRLRREPWRGAYGTDCATSKPSSFTRAVTAPFGHVDGVGDDRQRGAVDLGAHAQPARAGVGPRRDDGAIDLEPVETPGARAASRSRRARRPCRG